MAFLDETGLTEVRTKIEAVYRRRDDMIGTVMWWSGSISSIPSNAKICNGQSLSSTTYATLYARIGTTYGGDSTNFALPDLRTSSDYGRFVRARFKDIGSGDGQIPLADITQEDAIRNIIGQTYGYGVSNANYNNWGDFIRAVGTFTRSYSSTSLPHATYSGSKSDITHLTFNANTDTSDYGNPMVNHANGDDIHPYNISMVPIIIVS